MSENQNPYICEVMSECPDNAKLEELEIKKLNGSDYHAQHREVCKYVQINNDCSIREELLAGKHRSQKGGFSLLEGVK